MRIAPKALLLLVVTAFPFPLFPQELTKQQQQAAAEALTLVEEAVPSIADIEHPGTRIRAIVQAVQVYARAGYRNRGLTVLRQLLESFNKDMESSGMARAQAAVEAVRLLSDLNLPGEAAGIAADITDEGSRWFALSSVATAYARLGDFASAVQTLEAIPPGMSRDSSYQAIVYVCLSQKDWACASSAANAVTDPSMKAHLLGAIAVRKAHYGARDDAATDIAQAQAIVEGLPDSGQALGSRNYRGCTTDVRPTPRDVGLYEIAESQAGLGDFVAARRALDSIQDHQVRENVIISMTMAAARQGNFDLAYSLAGETARAQCRSIALSWIAYNQYRAGQKGAAAATMARISETSERVTALLNMAGLQGRDRTAAASTLVLASEVALQEPDLLKRFGSLLQVARRQAAVGSVDQFRVTLRAALDLVGQQPKQRFDNMGRSWDSLTLTLAGLLAEKGDLTQAAELARRVNLPAHPEYSLARRAAIGGHTEAARTFADSQPALADRTLALIGIATGILDRARIGRSPASSW